MATKKFTTISPLKTIFTLLVLACMCMQAKAQNFSWTWDANSSGGDYPYNQNLNVSSIKSGSEDGEKAHWEATANNTDNTTGFQTSSDRTSKYFNTGYYTFYMKISSAAFESFGEIASDTKLRITLNVNYAQDGTDVSQIVFKAGDANWSDIKTDYNHPSAGICSYEFSSTEVATIKQYGLIIGGRNINWNKVTIRKYDNNSEITLYDTEYKIVSWYTDPIILTSQEVVVGQTLRVYCKGIDTEKITNRYPTDDSYAFLKKDPETHTPIMSGSDKFSIAGWEYFEIKINEELKGILNGTGLIIGGNNYIIDRVVVYGSGSAEEWTDGAPINTYTCDVTTGYWVNGVDVPGNFFQYEYNSSNSATDKTFNNTKNNIIRVNFSATDATNGSQISVSDKCSDGDKYASYTRYRKHVKDNNYQYQDYIDLASDATHYDFEMSDAITIFESFDNSKRVVEGAAGVKKGMLSDVTKNGMYVKGNNLTITSIEILPSRVSRYVSGQAVYVHQFSKDQWRPMSLPYNLSDNEFKEAFKSYGVKYCQLGSADAVKKQFRNGDLKETDYFLKMHFVTANGIRCNYPYIVKLNNDAPSDNTYTFNVKADVRDFQTYTFRTGELQYKTEEAGTEAWTEEDKTNYAPTDSYMNFVSTAPVFDIYNEDQGKVEKYGTTVFFTPLAASSTTGDYNYYFYNGALCPAQTSKNLYSGLAYVQMSGSLHNLIEGQKVVNGQAKSMGFSTALFDIDDDENITSGIRTTETFDQHVSKTAAGVYNFNGQLISRNADTSNLPKGMYIINGKKTIIK